MENNLEDRIQKEIARRAFEKAELKEKQLKTRFSMEVLEEMTGLSQTELAAIEKEVRERPPQAEDTFFSIKHQVLIAAVVILILWILFW